MEGMRSINNGKHEPRVNCDLWLFILLRQKIFCLYILAQCMSVGVFLFKKEKLMHTFISTLQLRDMFWPDILTYRKSERSLMVYLCSLPLSLTTKQRFTGPTSEKISSRCSVDADAGKLRTNKVSPAILPVRMMLSSKPTPALETLISLLRKRERV